MAERWLPRLEGLPLLVAVQDGMGTDDVEPWLGPLVGLAIGGSTAWKERSARIWGRSSRRRLCHLHMLRVNTERRIRIAHEAGVHSVDGTSATRFAVNAARLARAVRRPDADRARAEELYTEAGRRPPWAPSDEALEVARRGRELLETIFEASGPAGCRDVLFPHQRCSPADIRARLRRAAG